MYGTLPEFLISLAIELIKLIIVMSGVFGFAFHSDKKRYAICAGVTAGIVAVLYKFSFMNVVTLPLTAVLIAALIMIGPRKIRFTIISEFFIGIADETLNLLVSRYFENYIVKSSFTIILVSILAYFLKNRKKRGMDFTLGNMNLFYLLILALAQFVVLFYSSEIRNTSGLSKLFVYILICIVLVVEIVLVYALSQRSYYLNISTINQKMLETQENYYTKLLDHENEIRKFRHDVNNHFISIEALIQEGRYQEASEYISNLKEAFINTNPEIKTGNTIVSAIASDCASRFPDAELEWNGMIPEELMISKVDICTIFSNVLSNAFENAVLSENEKTVNVKIETLRNNMIVTVANSLGGPVKMKDGVFETSKEDKLNHGIGTQNIKRCVEKNKGEIEYSFDENRFEVRIILPNVLNLF